VQATLIVYPKLEALNEESAHFDDWFRGIGSWVKPEENLEQDTKESDYQSKSSQVHDKTKHVYM
jgi:hypothetical protein